MVSQTNPIGGPKGWSGAKKNSSENGSRSLLVPLGKRRGAGDRQNPEIMQPEEWLAAAFCFIGLVAFFKWIGATNDQSES